MPGDQPSNTDSLWWSVSGPSGDPVTFLHGFTQTRRSWDHHVGQVATTRRMAFSVDLPGHGRSASIDANLWETAELVGAAMRRGALVGYSMGGRVGLHVAILRPELVSRLVLVGATAGIDDPAERERRRIDDDERADHLVSVGVEAFLEEWLRQPLFQTLPESQAGRHDRMANTAAGLARSLRRCGTGVQDSLWGRLTDIDCPVDVVVGELDTKFTALGRRLVDSLPRAQLHVIPEAGHACHLERPEAFSSLLLKLLAETPTAAS